jgi:hypothetical protein
MGKNQPADQIQPNNIIQCQQKTRPKLFSVHTYTKYNLISHNLNITSYRKNIFGFFFPFYGI